MTGTTLQILEQYTRDMELLCTAGVDAAKIDKLSLMDEMLDQPRRYLHWSCLSDRAASRARVFEDHYKEVKADCQRQVRYELSKSNVRVTKDMVEDHTLLLPTYKNALKQYRTAQEVADLLRSIEKALSGRERMLQSVNSRDKEDLRANANHSTPAFDDNGDPVTALNGDHRECTYPKDWDGAEKNFLSTK